MESSDTSVTTTKEKPEAKRFAIDVSWVFVSTFSGLIIGIVFRILLGNYFGEKGLGLFTMVTILTAIAGIAGDFGVPAALVKFISEHPTRKKQINKLISTSILNALVSGLILTSVFFIFAENIAQLFNMPELTNMLRLVSIMFPFLIINDMFIGIFNGHRWMKKYTVLILTRRVGILVISWALILFGWGVIAAIFALVVKEILTMIFNFVMIRKQNITFSVKGHFKTSKKIFEYGKYLFMGEGVGYFNSYLDTFMIGYFLTDKDVGVYAIASLIFHFFLTIPFSISRITFPLTSELYGKKNYKKIERVLNLCMRYSFVIVTILGLLTIFFGKNILRLVFPDRPGFLNAYLPMVILLVGVSIRSIFFSVENVFTSAGRPDMYLKIGSMIIFVNIFLNAFLIPKYGITGGALATTIALSSSSVVVYFALRRIIKLNVNLKWAILGFPVYLVFVLVFLYQNFINSYLMIIILFPLYILILFITKIFTWEDTKYLRKMVFKSKKSKKSEKKKKRNRKRKKRRIKKENL